MMLAVEQAILKSLKQLDASISAGRTMSLPNLVRLCQRIMSNTVASKADCQTEVTQLKAFYIRHQPFKESATQMYVQNRKNKKPRRRG